MGLWLKKDGEFVPVSGGGSGGGSFDGEHVPTGDPTDPAMFEALDVGQLLYDGVEDTGGAATELTQQIVKFNTAGTFEFKKADYPNLAFVNVEAIGGGGAGGTAPANPAGENKASVAAGGGSGGYGFRTLMASDLADVESVVVGAGGTASLTRSMVDGVETVGTGGDGGASLAFGINVHGGTGGQSVQTSGGGDYLVARPGVGGGVYGDNDYGVRGGAGFAPDAQVQRSMGGNGGGVMFAVGGFGGNAVTATGQAGANGHNGGGGGGGANRANNDAVQVGGAGGDGIVVVTVFSVTGSGGGGGDAGPHDHDEYAPVEHDHDYLPLAGGTLTGDLIVDTYASIGGAVVQGFFCNVAARSAEYIEWPSSIAFGQIQLAGNTISTTGSALLHYRSNQGYTVESGKTLRTTDGTSFQDAGHEVVANTGAPTGTTYPDGHITVVPHDTGDKYRLYIENNTDANRSWVGMWMGTAPITGGSSGVSRSVADVKELSARIEELEGA
jgi:hypothetical protein